MNISLSLKGSGKKGTRTETKNLNSFRSVDRLVATEINRQGNLLAQNKKISQQTLGFNVNTSEIKVLREKSNASDYRYFPEPNLPPLVVEQELIDRLAKDLPELPDKKRERFISTYNISNYDANFLITSRPLADYFEEAVKFYKGKDVKKIVNWIMVELSCFLKGASIPIEKNPISPRNLSELVNAIEKGILSGRMAKEVFEKMFDEKKTVDTLIEEMGLRQINDRDEIKKIIQEVLKKHSVEVEKYRNGHNKLFGFFVGQVMKASKGQANPALVNTLLREHLSVS